MIHSARLIVTLVVNIVFCCFVFYISKVETDGRTDFGLADWINCQFLALGVHFYILTFLVFKVKNLGLHLQRPDSLYIELTKYFLFL